ncbi:MAG: DUF4139 domain-containing protein [Cytophagales bacterium]|nr:DUF4139 domain-containing protein [Cytophagales bacterium]
MNLLPGELHVYFAGSYVAKSYLDPTSTKDTLEISLGRDPELVVERKQLKEFSSERLIGSKTKRTLAYEISLRSNKSKPVKIKIEDQIPVSKNGDLTIEDVEQGGGQFNPETGQLTWLLELKPKEQRQLRFSFAAKYPKEKRIIGF